MPGHTQAAIAAYPRARRRRPSRSTVAGPAWGINARRPQRRATRPCEFFRHVFDEVIDLFPGPCIGVGGDECPKDQWRASRAAQERMAELGLRDEDALQSWFIGRFARSSPTARAAAAGLGRDPRGRPAAGRDRRLLARPARRRHGGHGRPRRRRLPRTPVYLDYRQSDGSRRADPGGHACSTWTRCTHSNRCPPELAGTPEEERVIGAQAQPVDRGHGLRPRPRLPGVPAAVRLRRGGCGRTGRRRLSTASGPTARAPARAWTPSGSSTAARTGHCRGSGDPGVRGRPVALADYLAGVAEDTRNIR